MNSIYYQPYECPIGKVRLRANDEGLLALEHWNQQEQLPDCWVASDSHPILLQARSELDEYFTLKRQVFSTPLAPKGTAFQRRVWDALLEIPFGETCSYSERPAHVNKRLSYGHWEADLEEGAKENGTF